MPYRIHTILTDNGIQFAKQPRNCNTAWSRQMRFEAEKTGREAPNPKRVYRVMKVHGLLLQLDGERREERRHNGGVAVDLRNTRWYSDVLEITCDNGEKVRVAFALDRCDREAIGHVATSGGITAEDVQDLMVATVEHRYGQVNRAPEPIG